MKSKTGINIERIDPKSYLKDLIDLQKHCLPNDEPLKPDSEGDGWWWLAFKDDLPVAFAGLKPSARILKAGYLARSGVHDFHRGLGLQRRLIQVRINFARKLGYEWLFSDTIGDNIYSSNNLINCGFKLFLPQSPWGNPGALYFRKKL